MESIKKPKIRPLEIFPTVVDGKEVMVLRDPLDLLEKTIFVSPESFFLVSLMDGTRTLDDLRMEFFKRKGILPSSEEIYLLVKQLSQLALLEDENYLEVLKEKSNSLIKNGKRKSICAGTSYPSLKEDLINFLKEIEKIEVIRREKEPDLLISPHLDINISKIAYANSYKFLNLKNKKNIVIFGVSHYGLSKPISILPLDFETPLGIAKINKDLAKIFIEKFGEPDPYSIISHSKEHSIELQVIFLQYFFGEDFSFLPFLVDSSAGPFEEYLDFFYWLIEKKDTFFIAGIDLSHIGPRYGDNFIPDENLMENIKLEEKKLLEIVIKKDKEGFKKFEEEKSSFLRICGISVLKLLMEFPLKDGIIRCHHSGFMPAFSSYVNCISMDIYF